jgi:hypothetical protein
MEKREHKMANSKGKVNPTVENIHRPNLRPASGQGNPPNDVDRSFIKSGPQKNPKPAKS